MIFFCFYNDLNYCSKKELKVENFFRNISEREIRVEMVKLKSKQLLFRSN